MKKNLFIIGAILFSSLIACADSFYVRPKGGSYGLEDGSSYANAFDGFSDISWGTGAGQVGPGDQMYVAGTHNELLMVGASGTSASYLVISSCRTLYGASNEDPGIIDRGVAISDWTSEGSGVYSVTAGAPYFLMEDSKPLKYASSAACSDGNWYHSNNTLYYKPATGVPEDYTIEKPGAYTGVCLDNRSYVTVEALSIKKCFVGIRNIETPTTGSSSNYIRIKACTVEYCREGYASFVDNSLPNIGIEILENTFKNLARSIALYSSGNTGLEHQECIIEDNTIILPGAPYAGASYDWSDAVPQAYIDQEGIGLQNVVECVIEGNTITNGPATGIILYVEEDANVMDNIVMYNPVQSDRRGIEIGGHYAGAEISGNLIAYNLLKYCGESGANNPAGIVLGNVLNADAGWNFCYNNTLMRCENSIILTGHGNYWKIKNNIMQSSTNYHIWAKGEYTTYPDKDWDYNLFWWDGASKFKYINTEYNLSGWRTNTGQDSNSFIDGADFVNGSSDFHLRSISPCINAGTSVGLTEDFDGDAISGNPDIGYDEYY